MAGVKALRKCEDELKLQNVMVNVIVVMSLSGPVVPVAKAQFQRFGNTLHNKAPVKTLLPYRPLAYDRIRSLCLLLRSTLSVPDLASTSISNTVIEISELKKSILLFTAVVGCFLMNCTAFFFVHTRI